MRYKQCFRGMVNNNELKYHQFQVVRNCLKTNAIVSHFVAIVNEGCSFGCNDKELISHLYWDCPFVYIFWQQVKIFFRDKCNTDLNFDKLNVLFGMHRENSTSIANTIILLAKRFIWRQKFSSLKPKIDAFCNYVLKYLCTLKVVFEMKSNGTGFERLWGEIVESLTQFRDEHAEDAQA